MRRRKKRGTDEQKESERGREKKKEWERESVKSSQASVGAVDHDAVLEESGQIVALHANQISQLRGLFVHTGGS